MSSNIKDSIRRYKQVIIIVAAAAAIVSYMLPLESLFAQASPTNNNIKTKTKQPTIQPPPPLVKIGNDKTGNDKTGNKNNGNDNCENGLPHGDGKHYGCLKHGGSGP